MENCFNGSIATYLCPRLEHIATDIQYRELLYPHACLYVCFRYIVENVAMYAVNKDS